MSDIMDYFWHLTALAAVWLKWLHGRPSFNSRHLKLYWRAVLFKLEGLPWLSIMSVIRDLFFKSLTDLK